jgi:hypothetical protein
MDEDDLKVRILDGLGDIMIENDTDSPSHILVQLPFPLL